MFITKFDLSSLTKPERTHVKRLIKDVARKDSSFHILERGGPCEICVGNRKRKQAYARGYWIKEHADLEKPSDLTFEVVERYDVEL